MPEVYDMPQNRTGTRINSDPITGQPLDIYGNPISVAGGYTLDPMGIMTDDEVRAALPGMTDAERVQIMQGFMQEETGGTIGTASTTSTTPKTYPLPAGSQQTFTDKEGAIWSWNDQTGQYEIGGYDTMSNQSGNVTQSQLFQTGVDSQNAALDREYNYRQMELDNQYRQGLLTNDQYANETNRLKTEYENAQFYANQNFQSQQDQLNRQWETGERLGSQDWQSQQDAMNRQWNTSERLGSQTWQSQQDALQRTHDQTMLNLQQQFQASQNALDRQRLYDQMAQEQKQFESQMAWYKEQQQNELNWNRESLNTQIGWQREQQQAELAAQKQAQLAELAQNPYTWVQYNQLNQTPLVYQPWQTGMVDTQSAQQQFGGQPPTPVSSSGQVQPTPMPIGQLSSATNQQATNRYPAGTTLAGVNQAPTDMSQWNQPITGQVIPGSNQYGGSLVGKMPQLLNPSMQHMNNLSPSERGQYFSYQQANTARTPEDQAWYLQQRTSAPTTTRTATFAR